jgi:hypothetical protein
VIPLPPDKISGYSFFDLDRYSAISERHVYVAQGFPWKGSGLMEGRRLSTTIQNYRSLEMNPYPRRIDRQNQIAIKFNRKQSYNFDEQRVRAMKDPSGMSGGALWGFEWRPRDSSWNVALVGVLTSRDPSDAEDGWMAASRTESVLATIRRGNQEAGRTHPE